MKAFKMLFAVCCLLFATAGFPDSGYFMFGVVTPDKKGANSGYKFTYQTKKFRMEGFLGGTDHSESSYFSNGGTSSFSNLLSDTTIDEDKLINDYYGLGLTVNINPFSDKYQVYGGATLIGTSECPYIVEYAIFGKGCAKREDGSGSSGNIKDRHELYPTVSLVANFRKWNISLTNNGWYGTNLDIGFFY